MARAFAHGLVVFALVAAALAHGRAASPGAQSPVLQRFLALGDPTPSQVRALRHLEAQNERFEKSAWMDVWTEASGSTFRYEIVAEGGSDYIRERVMRNWLETERKVWASGAPDRAAFTPENYVFQDKGPQADGLSALQVKPLRRDLLLVDGLLFLNPDDGELIRIEGRLSKPPSFWTRHVDIVRWFRRIAGYRMPVALETVAAVRVAGRSTLRVTYDYESVDHQPVGHPVPRATTP